MSANLRTEEEVYLRELGFDETWLQRHIANDPTLLRITPAEQAVFLREHRKCALATIDQNGWPRLDAMIFVFRDGAFYMTSHDRAPQIVNILRNPKVAIMIETGSADAELKGLMARGECEIVRDSEAVREALAWFGAGSTIQRPNGSEQNTTNGIILKIHPRKIVTWDYSKLCGQYGAHT